MKDMGKADVILGIKIKRENKGIVITQSYYIEKILKKFNRKDCSPVSTPMDPVEKLKLNTRKHIDQLKYSRAISCLMYVMTSTRPNIAYVIERLSRFTSNPRRQHWKAITRVFKYLRGTKDYGLSYVRYPLVLEGYLDASWINHDKDSSSTSGWVFLLGGGPVRSGLILRKSDNYALLDRSGPKTELDRTRPFRIDLWSGVLANVDFGAISKLSNEERVKGVDVAILLAAIDETIDIQYGWQPPRRDTCKLVDHITDQCPKKVKVAATTQVSWIYGGNMEAYSQTKSNVHCEASTSQHKEIKEATLQFMSNAFSALKEDNGKPTDDLVDDAHKKGMAPLKKTPRKTDI
nr:zinc finger, CCHC-type [Tanacetum cinerariifolium]